MNFINCTPHPINVVSDGNVKTIHPSGKVARLASVRNKISTIDGVDIFKTSFGDPVDLPHPNDGVFIIVSALVRSAFPGRKDLVSPADFHRDSAGNIVSCGSFDCN